MHVHLLLRNGNRFGKNVAIFGVSLVYIHNKKNDILYLGKSPVRS